MIRLFICAFFISFYSYSQLLRNDISKPITYNFVLDRDILWSTIVWEYIDLSKEINYPFKYSDKEKKYLNNTETLYEVLLKGIQDKQIEVYNDSYFIDILNKDELKNRIESIDTLPLKYDYKQFTNCVVRDVLKVNIEPKHIKGYKIKGMYYFDKHYSELRYRIIGIAPVSISLEQIKSKEEWKIDDLVELFWVYYPMVREELHQEIVYHKQTPISMEMLLTSKRFDSLLYMEESEVYMGKEFNNDQLYSFFTLQKSNKIKDKIRAIELDMWCN